KGVVIETKPGDGQEVDVDSNVDLVVSSGMVEVPDVTGKSADEACKILEGDDYQLKCKTEEVETDDEDEKKVFEQSATGGTEVKQGTEITVKVAKKPSEPSPTMPSVPGGIPTSPSDDGGSDDDGNDDGDEDDKDKDTDSMGGSGGLFDGWPDAAGRDCARSAFAGVDRTSVEGEEEIRAQTRRIRLGAGLGDIEFDERQTRMMAGLDGRLEQLRPGLFQTVIAADVTADGHRSGGQLGGDDQQAARDRLAQGQARRDRDPHQQVDGLAGLPRVEGERRRGGLGPGLGQDREETGEGVVEQPRQVLPGHVPGLDDRGRTGRHLEDGEFGERVFSQIARF